VLGSCVIGTARSSFFAVLSIRFCVFSLPRCTVSTGTELGRRWSEVCVVT
jgi:hypothetical protein